MSEIMRQGGWVMWALAGLSLVGWWLIMWKWLELLAEPESHARWADDALCALRVQQRDHALELCHQHRNVISRIMLLAMDSPEEQRHFFEKRLAPALEAESIAMRRHLSLVGQLAAVAPLLGLLGTVLGMVETFAAITQHGLGNVGSLADGVGKALITTEAGLLIGLTLLLSYGYLANRARRSMNLATLYAKKIEGVLCHD